MSWRHLQAAAVVVAVGAVLASATTAGAATRRVTLGSTTGTPSENICSASIRCTYLPVSQTKLRVPFNGTVTRFRVNAGSAGGTVWLRVARPAGAGKFTGVATSAPETLAVGVNAFRVSLRVKAGDLIGLDNASSALMFDTSSAAAVTDYFELPWLRSRHTASPSGTQASYRLLLSATVVRRRGGTPSRSPDGLWRAASSPALASPRWASL